jgi:IS66 C-terminal element
VLESAKLNGLDPQAWLSDVIERMAKSHPINRLGELLPWNWNNQTPASPPDRCCGPQLTLTELGAKRLGLLHDIVPGARRIAALAVNVR